MFMHSPPQKGRETERVDKSQETDNIDLNTLTVNEIKEILIGEGLSDKGKVKADYVQRLHKHAVELGDENYTFILRKYPQFAKRATSNNE